MMCVWRPLPEGLLRSARHSNDSMLVSSSSSSRWRRRQQQHEQAGQGQGQQAETGGGSTRFGHMLANDHLC